MQAITCVVDWPGTMSFIKDVIISCAALFTSFVAYKGISKWRNEESGKADFDLARRLGKAVFQLRDLLRDARRPFTWAYEFPKDYEPSDMGKQAEAYTYLFEHRFLPVRGCAIEIQALRNEVEALWGNEMVAILNELLGCTRKLQTAMSAFISDKRDCGSHFASNKGFAASIQKRVFDDVDINPDGTEVAPNALTVEINGLVEQISAYLRTKLPTTA